MTPAKKNAFLIAIGVVAALLVMGWIVGERMGTRGAPLGTRGGPIGAAVSSILPSIKPDADKLGQLPVLADAMPPFTNIAKWINSDPLTPDSLKGKVVMIDFWTYSCINCIRTLPYVTAWHEKYKGMGFTVIGVHTPEFAFEKDEANVRRAVADHRITYPVAMDNDYGTWNAYSNEYWPAHYLFDAQGRLRYTHFGEGDYDVTEKAIQSLLAEAGKDGNEATVTVKDTSDFSQIGTPETYVGYGRQEYLGSPERVLQDQEQTYSAAENPEENKFYLFGRWREEQERGVLTAAPGGIVYKYHASNANLVMGAPVEVRAEITLDGQPVPEALRGSDLYEEGGKTYVKVSNQRLYDLIDAQGNYATHTLKIEFLGAGVQCYAFTFG